MKRTYSAFETFVYLYLVMMMFAWAQDNYYWSKVVRFSQNHLVLTIVLIWLVLILMGLWTLSLITKFKEPDHDEISKPD